MEWLSEWLYCTCWQIIRLDKFPLRSMVMISYILHLPKWYPNREDDLEGIFIQRHIEASYPDYKAVIIYSKVLKDFKEGPWYEIEKSDLKFGTEYLIYIKNKISKIYFLDKCIKFFLYYFLLFDLSREVFKNSGKPSLIHVHVLLRTGIAAMVINYFTKIPYLITEHSTFFTSSQKLTELRFKNIIRKWVVKRAAAVMTVSADLEAGMKSFGLENSNYLRIYNSADTQIFNYKEKPKSNSTNFLHVSEFKNEHKNVTGLLEATKLLSKQMTDFKLHLVGYGEDLKMIIQFIADHELSDFVIYHGKLTHQTLAQMYQAADAFVMFSNKENMPCVIAESLCCGTPVISSQVGGIAEIIHQDNGILIPKGDVSSLLKQMLKFCSGEYVFNRMRIAEQGHKLFSVVSINKMLSDIYFNCQNEPK